MRKTLGICLLLLAPLLSHAANLQYEGSSTIGKFISDAAVVYEPSTFSINVSPESLGGERCAAAHTCQLGGVAREVRPEVLQQDVRATVIGRDAISVIVNVRNPVSNLTREQLKGIFTGRIRNWSEVGGPNRTIRPYVVKSASATRQVFHDAILPDAEYGQVSIATPDRKIVAKVVHDWDAIGQISFAFIKDIKGVKPLSVDGEVARVDNPEYPITRPLILLTGSRPVPEVQAFVDWTLSPEGQDVVKQRFVGIR